jgi:hypothetical protein
LRSGVRHIEPNKSITEEKKDRTKGGTGPDLAIFGCLATGVLACVGGLTGIARNQIPGAGVCFLATALAFGIVVYVSFSD